MANGARIFSPEFKTVAIARFELGESPTALAVELGIDRSLIYKWRQAQRGGRPTVEPGERSAAAKPDKPPRRSMRTAAQAHADDALETLAAIMKKDGASETSRIAAANAILNRAHAKPDQAASAAAPRKPLPTRIEWVIVDPKG